MSPRWCSLTLRIPDRNGAETSRYDAAPMPTVADVLRRFEHAAPSSGAASWDPVGLQLGDPVAEISSVAVCHEVNEEVVDRVTADATDLLVTYHPLLFRPVSRLTAGPSAAGRAYRLVSSGVAVAVIHTSFDTAPGGTADSLADALALTSVRPFGPAGPAPTHKIVTFVPAGAVDAVVTAMTDAGAGRIGDYRGCHFRSDGTGAFVAEEEAAPRVGGPGLNRVPEVRIEMFAPPGTRDRAVAALVSVHPYEEPAFDVYETISNERFIGRVGTFDGSFEELTERSVRLAAGRGGIRVTVASDRAETVAVVPGSGSSFLAAATDAGADVIVTGDVDHHRAVEARDRGLSIVDPGHAATERPGIGALVSMVRDRCPDLEVRDLTDRDPTPWR